MSIPVTLPKGRKEVLADIRRDWPHRKLSSANDPAEPLVPDGIWELAAPLIPPARKRAQGGGRARIDDREVLAAIAFVLIHGCTWRQLPPGFAVSHQTAHRRFRQWSEIGLWERIHQAVRDRPGAEYLLEWVRKVEEAADRRRS